MEHLTDLSSKEFLTKLASNTPTPGGGGAAALAGALAAALGSMLANLTIGKKGFEQQEDEAKDLLAKAETMRKQILLLVEKDAEVFDTFMHSYRMAKNTKEEKQKRQEAINNAAKKAAQIPMEIAQLCIVIMQVTARLVEIGNPNVITDGAVSGLLARAAVRSSIYNILVNLSLTADNGFNAGMEKECMALEKKALELENRILNKTNEVIKR